jgi:NAD(P)H-hydrate epimerase
MGKNHDGALEKALDRARRLVVDADGIRAFCRLKARAAGNCILTPHPGEFEALRKTYCPGIASGTPDNFHEALAACSEAAGAVVAYKADTLWIQGKSGSFAVDGSNPSLGVAGSGDVLAGITAALAARSADGDMEKTACSAVLLHQKAGRLAREDLGFYPSSELVKYIGRAI